jgi:glutamate--cysteine ligase
MPQDPPRGRPAAAPIPAPIAGADGPAGAPVRAGRLATPPGPVDGLLAERLARLPSSAAPGLVRGIEKEGLRVDRHGALSQRSHPRALGSPLTNPRITTDFSEAQLELVTGVHPSLAGCLGELDQIHRFVMAGLDDEVMWACSMPCRLPDEALIPIGRYGTSNIARSKTVYRIGLGNRYGRRMQTISGVHYNFSLPDALWPALIAGEQDGGDPQVVRSRLYFSLIRNFRRWAWLLLYLFGASPAVNRSFVADREHRLEPLGHDSFHLPFATSLRMGRLGYQSDAQASIAVGFNDLSEYAAALRRALHRPWPDYERIGLRDGDDYRQLSTSLLQIENEFYGVIRPKRRIRTGERALRALGERGVEYVEARCLDLDPFAAIGIAEPTARFMDIFLLGCLLADSPSDTAESPLIASRNQHAVAERGREPGLRLESEQGELGLREWGKRILGTLDPVARWLDESAASTEAGAPADGAVPRSHRDALESAAAALDDPSHTASARVLAQMLAEHGGSHQAFALEQSRRHREALLARPLDAESLARFRALADESDLKRQRLDAEEREPFESFRERYLDQV